MPVLTACPLMPATVIGAGRCLQSLGRHAIESHLLLFLRRQPWRALLIWRRCRRTRGCCAPQSCWPSCATLRCASPAAACVIWGAVAVLPQLPWQWH